MNIIINYLKFINQIHSDIPVFTLDTQLENCMLHYIGTFATPQPANPYATSPGSHTSISIPDENNVHLRLVCGRNDIILLTSSNEPMHNSDTLRLVYGTNNNISSSSLGRLLNVQARWYSATFQNNRLQPCRLIAHKGPISRHDSSDSTAPARLHFVSIGPATRRDMASILQLSDEDSTQVSAQIGINDNTFYLDAGIFEITVDLHDNAMYLWELDSDDSRSRDVRVANANGNTNTTNNDHTHDRYVDVDMNMGTQSDDHIVWTQHDKEIMEYHLQKIKRLKKMHELEAASIKRKNSAFFISSLLLGGVSSVYSFAALNEQYTNDQDDELRYESYVLGSTVALASILNAIQHHYGWSEMATKHLEVANEYSLLADKIEWNIDFPTISTRELSFEVQNRLFEIHHNHKGLLISEKIRKQFEENEKDEQERLQKWQQAELELQEKRIQMRYSQAQQNMAQAQPLRSNHIQRQTQNENLRQRFTPNAIGRDRPSRPSGNLNELLNRHFH